MPVTFGLSQVPPIFTGTATALAGFTLLPVIFAIVAGASATLAARSNPASRTALPVYAVDLRYGVLLDIGTKVYESRPVDVTMGHLNAIWQGDANSVCLRSFALCQSPPSVLNLTGTEVLAVRDIAARFGELLGHQPVLQGREADTALLNNAGRCHGVFGRPSVDANTVIEWTARWIQAGGTTWAKPTHFETRDGRF